MTLPTFNPSPAPGSPPLSMLDIQGEFGGSAPISLSEYYSAASGIPASGTISIRNFYGTSARKSIYLNINSPTYNYSVWSNANSSGYVAGLSDIYVNVGPSVYVGSTNHDNYAMQVEYFNAADTVRITNNGNIQGMGGTGGDDVFGSSNPSHPGTYGGNALYLSVPTTVYNYGTIAGGGGGGGSSAGATPFKGPTRWGGAGGGGAGYAVGPGGADTGSGGPGSPGYLDSGGAGGTGYPGQVGGAGGGLGAAGAHGTNNSGNSPSTGGDGGAPGYYVVGYSYANSGQGLGGTTYGPATG